MYYTQAITNILSQQIINQKCEKCSLHKSSVPVCILVFLSFQNITRGQEHWQAMHSNKEGKLLAVLPVEDSTGLTLAYMTAHTIKDWGCASKVKTPCFDTMSSKYRMSPGRHSSSGGAARKAAAEAGA